MKQCPCKIAEVDCEYHRPEPEALGGIDLSQTAEKLGYLDPLTRRRVIHDLVRNQYKIVCDDGVTLIYDYMYRAWTKVNKQ